jgi:hypothetical protein
MHNTAKDYEVRVSGTGLPAELLDSLTVLDEMAPRPSTVFVCHVEDPAGLHGLLARITSLGLDVMEIRPVPPHETEPTPVTEARNTD